MLIPAGFSVLPSVIASEAKQSLLTFMRLLRAGGPRNDNRKTPPEASFSFPTRPTDDRMGILMLNQSQYSFSRFLEPLSGAFVWKMMSSWIESSGKSRG